MYTRLEHANLIVRNIDETIRFLTTALPDFEVRHDSGGERRWVHVGTAHSYIALTEATSERSEKWVPYEGKPGVNHLAFEVDDVAALRRRMIAAGYRDTTLQNSHPHRRRVYFEDPEGNDWEFVQYLSNDARDRNDYALPDRT